MPLFPLPLGPQRDFYNFLALLNERADGISGLAKPKSEACFWAEKAMVRILIPSELVSQFTIYGQGRARPHM